MASISTHDSNVRMLDLLKHPTQGETTLYLIRHGQTLANINHQLVGTTDIPLDPLGERQARWVAERMRDVHLDALLSSPLTRARATATEIARITGREPEIIPGLSEIHFGNAEGLTIDQVVLQFPEIAHLVDDIDDVSFAWPGGDSRRGFHQRVFTTFLGILERYERQHVAVVCHGGVIGSFFAQIEGGSPNDFARYAVANCSITHLVVTPDHTQVHLWNEIGHLEEVQRTPLRLRPNQ
jgi:broad specificity phosphatase PhoE